MPRPLERPTELLAVGFGSEHRFDSNVVALAVFSTALALLLAYSSFRLARFKQRAASSIEEAERLATLLEHSPAALVLLSADTKKRVSFLGTKQQRVKWTPIASVLKASYKKNPTNAVKALHKLLYKFDALDSKKGELASQLARAEKKNNKYKAARVQKKMLLAKKDRTEVLAEEEKLRKLVLRASSDE